MYAEIELADFLNKNISSRDWFLNNIINDNFYLSTENRTVYNKFTNKTITLPHDLRDFNIRININKCRRELSFRIFVYMYFNKAHLPDNTRMIYATDGEYFGNFKLIPLAQETGDFYNNDIPDEQWFLNKILEGRFELLENDTKIYDTFSDKYTVPGNRCAVNNEEFDRYFEYSVFSAIPKYKHRKMLFHRFVWMYYHKWLVPKGYHVHHKDENKQHNWHKNLELITGSEHVHQHSDDTTYKLNKYTDDFIKKVSAGHKLRSYLLYKYCFYEKKPCNSCERLLLYEKFGTCHRNDKVLNLSTYCKECSRLIAKNGLVYTKNLFVKNLVTDIVVIDCRFKFNIMNNSFKKVLKKYKHIDLNEKDLKDILLGNTYTHIDTLHGIHDTPYRKEKYINQIEHCHIQHAQRQAQFTPEELAKIYGRSLDEIIYVLTVGRYRPEIEMVKDVHRYISNFI